MSGQISSEKQMDVVMRNRRNPHQERAQIKAKVKLRHATRSKSTSEVNELRRIKAPTGYVIVLLDPTASTLHTVAEQAVALAQDLGGDADIAVLGVMLSAPNQGALPDVFDRLLTCPTIQCPDATATFLLNVVQESAAQTLIYWESQPKCADIARRVAVKSKLTMSTDVFEVNTADGTCVSLRGSSETKEKLGKVIGLHQEFGWSGGPDRCETLPMELEVPPGDCKIELVGETRLPANAVPLSEAEFILSAGAGLSNLEDFFALAELCGASIAGSREACDAGKIARDRQVGTTGALVQAKVYLAFGISGAPQHLEGIEHCQHVVSVNSDPSCAMSARADFSVVGDANDVVSQLMSLYRESSFGRTP